MGTCSRLTLLLTTPCFSLLLHPRSSHFRLTRLSLSTRLSVLPIKAAAGNHYHNAAAVNNNSGGNYVREANYGDESQNHFSNYRSSPSHPWAEWSNLIHQISAAGCFDVVHQDDEFVAYESLSEEFSRAATACLSFARNRSDLFRMLSRKDIEVIVENGTPFLFKSAFDSSRRLKSFLGIGNANVSISDTTEMVDLMKYLLSYASNPAVSVSSEINKSYSRDKIEASVRNLLSELAQMGCSGRAQEHYQVSQVPRSQNIEMKRGDWICPRCTFMNFARNQKCLDCEESRPKRNLTGGEWECPKCDFYNYGRNMVCLKCDCKRPGEVSSGTVNPRPAYNEDYTVASKKPNFDSSNQDKAEKWFNNVSQQNYSDLPDEDFPDIMPLRKGENKFVVSTRKTPLDRRLENSNSGQTRSDTRTVDSSYVDRSLDQILGPTSSRTESRYNANYTPFVPLPADMFAKKPQSPASDGTNPVLESKQTNANAAREYSQEMMPTQKGENRFVASNVNDHSSFTPPTHRRQTPVERASGYDSKFTPFVPLPPDYFAKKQSTESTVKDSRIEAQSSSPQITQPRQTPTSSQARDSANVGGQSINNKNSGGESGNTRISGGWNGKSLEGSAVKETDPLDMSEEAKAERFFKRVAQIKDISELGQIPDEDFPSIMPMRKGVNRFVVSKRKTPLERRLTSPQYRRNLPVFERSDTPGNQDDKDEGN